ncbi:MAG: TetR/AcrR family transcriptional regulator [Lachnospiraceae bacterium]|nr:TetR/AcrR family transcriptional regulator [Lachnospiraceae bacterium]
MAEEKKTKTRMPKLDKALAKRSRIIEKGFELICEKGYHSTTTPEIAKYADVSTGIIYQYFKDKKEIFIEGLKKYSESILFPMSSILDISSDNVTKVSLDDIELILDRIITLMLQRHRMSQKAHEEIFAMAHSDPDVAEIFANSELAMTTRIEEFIEKNGIKLEHPKEKIHLIYGIVENYCHETIYHHHAELNNEVMRREVILIIKNILKSSLEPSGIF